MIRELNHVGVFSPDIDASITFYRDIFGGILIRDGVSMGGKSRFVYAQVGVGVFELLKSSPDNPQTGYSHVAYLVGERGIDSCYRELSEKGFDFSRVPAPAASGLGYIAFYKDLSGSTFELLQREEDIRKPAFQTDIVASFDGIVLNVPEEKLDEIDSHYVNAFGLERRGEKRGGIRYGIGGDHLILRAGGDVGIDSVAFTAAPGAKDALIGKGVAIAEDNGEFFVVYGPGGERLVFYYD
ncbi:MAG: VOC family protein [Oscillospiraceae bacterium]|nr:VOC family protein [Oscillospiraceae bacterium]